MGVGDGPQLITIKSSGFETASCMQCVQQGKFHSCDTTEVAGHVHFGVHQVKWAFEEIPGHHEHGGLQPVMTDFNRWQGDIDQSDDGE